MTPRYGRWRLGVQLAVAAFYLALPLGGFTAVAGTMAALKLGPVELLEPAGALSAALAARALSLALVLGAAPVVLLGLALGPVYCSWACPFGLVSEGLDRLRSPRRRRWGGRPWVAARRTRLTALAALLGGSFALGVPLAALVAPPRVLTGLPLEARAAVPWTTAVLLAAVLALELLGPRRLVCRALCPAGALAALLRTRRTLAPRFDASRCRCPEVPACAQACPWGLDPRESRPADGCTTCLACLDRCPSGALTLRSTQHPRNPQQQEVP